MYSLVANYVYIATLAIILFMYMQRKGIVVQESIEGFRQHLAKLQNMKGLTSEEKGKTVMSGFIVYVAI